MGEMLLLESIMQGAGHVGASTNFQLQAGTGRSPFSKSGPINGVPTLGEGCRPLCTTDRLLGTRLDVVLPLADLQ